MAVKNESNGIQLPLAGLLTALSVSFTLGGSVSGAWLSVQNGERSINVAVQHGEEISQLNARLSRIESDVVRRTAERWTRTDQTRYQAQSERGYQATDRRLSALERIVDREHNK